MTTTMNDADRARFLQTLRSDPDFRDEVRSLLLAEELLRLPERFAQFAAYVNDFIESQKVFNEEQKTFNASVADFIEDQKETNSRVEHRLQQITDDLGDLKGHVAGRIAREMADDIAERLGFELVETLRGDDLRRMLRQHNPVDIDPGTRRSFYLADLVAKVLDQEGNELFMATEASYTADPRDANRAVRNAEFLTRFTGVAGVAVVASRQNDHAVQQLVDNGSVLWFEFSQRDLTPQ